MTERNETINLAGLSPEDAGIIRWEVELLRAAKTPATGDTAPETTTGPCPEGTAWCTSHSVDRNDPADYTCSSTSRTAGRDLEGHPGPDVSLFYTPGGDTSVSIDGRLYPADAVLDMIGVLLAVSLSAIRDRREAPVPVGDPSC